MGAVMSDDPMLGRLTPWIRVEHSSKRDSCIALALLAKGMAQLLAEDFHGNWTMAERLVFNGSSILYAHAVLQDQELVSVLSQGDQIHDTHVMLGDMALTQRAARRVVAQARRYIRNKTAGAQGKMSQP
jgi:hypothetical protein